MNNIPSQTLAEAFHPDPDLPARGLDLGSIPPISILSAHFKDDEEDNIKATLRMHGATLTNDISKTVIFIGKVGTKRRAEFELRSRKFKVEAVSEPKQDSTSKLIEAHPSKKRKLSESWKSDPIVISDGGSTTEEEGEGKEATSRSEKMVRPDTSTTPPLESQLGNPLPMSLTSKRQTEDFVWVLKVDWLNACLAADHLVAFGEYVVYKGKVLERPRPVSRHKSIKAVFTAPSEKASPHMPQSNPGIIERARADVVVTVASKNQYQRHRAVRLQSRQLEGKSFMSGSRVPASISQTAHLLQQTTSEYEGEDSDIPPPPDWVKKGVKYACQRFTPADGPNEDFINQLKKIRMARTLTDDEIGVRAYSTIIASIAAYPFKLSHPRELARLPGCDEKTILLFVEWKNTGRIQAVEDYENDEAMKILRSFFDIWGVGAKTARHFYYNKQWVDLNDVIEYGWQELDRVQQIGVKYYDEFLESIPRTEVEQIARIVRQHAVRLRDNRITVTIVGGYRRGKTASGDVDMIISHPNLEATAGLISELVESLEDDKWITHRLILSLKNTQRGQSTLPFRTTKASGAGFDTLDKALVVWQDPFWPTRDADLSADPNAKNPNIHRRVDIIVSPWRTVGCAVMGWSGGTTFQRDLRRYAKYVKGWKFDSSGIRSRVNGEVVELEGPHGVDGSPEDAERAVFEGMGLEFVPAQCRCTY
ncbi:Nucleotidyltransferase [Periconia macrospinosa]|uniref:DNA-directed DNA polymerase n=1 Tax=Periconia macrospinosa TaxID=97972 RepID=A0A2V1EAK7_9PLEO|nr:Nucleotidyltransferase [Periconia macrospinosa]